MYFTLKIGSNQGVYRVQNHKNYYDCRNHRQYDNGHFFALHNEFTLSQLKIVLQMLELQNISLR